MNPDIRRKWMIMLAKLVRPTDAEAAAQALIDMLPMLDDVPDQCFCSRCLKHIASVCRKMPTFGELQDAFGDWWRDNKHEFNRAALSAPAAPGGMDDMDHRWVAYYRLRESEGFSNAPSQADDPRAHVLSLVKVNAPRAWSVLTGISLTPRAVPTEDEKARVSRTLRPLSELVAVQVAA